MRDVKFLKRQLLDMRSIRMFMALYQGRPQPADGSTFKQEWFRYFRRVGDFLELLSARGDVMARYPISSCRAFQIVDLSAGDTSTLRSGITRVRAKPDYTVVGTFALCPRKELAVLDMYRNNEIDGPDQIALLSQLRTKWRAGRIGIEAVAYQWTAVQTAVKAGLPVVAITRGQESKETRAWTIAARYETGQVFHSQGAPWVDALEAELLAFPAGANDDQVDVMSDAGDVVSQAENRPCAQCGNERTESDLVLRAGTRLPRGERSEVPTRFSLGGRRSGFQVLVVTRL